MANLSKIKVGNISYDIVPKLGTGLMGDAGILCLNIGSGITFNEKNEVRINLGTGLDFENKEGKIFVTLGTAKASNDENINTGIGIIDGMFRIDNAAFKSYLASLGISFL